MTDQPNEPLPGPEGSPDNADGDGAQRGGRPPLDSRAVAGFAFLGFALGVAGAIALPLLAGMAGSAGAPPVVGLAIPLIAYVAFVILCIVRIKGATDTPARSRWMGLLIGGGVAPIVTAGACVGLIALTLNSYQ